MRTDSSDELSSGVESLVEANDNGHDGTVALTNLLNHFNDLSVSEGVSLEQVFNNCFNLGEDGEDVVLKVLPDVQIFEAVVLSAEIGQISNDFVNLAVLSVLVDQVNDVLSGLESILIWDIKYFKLNDLIEDLCQVSQILRDP